MRAVEFKATRKALGMTQQALGDALGLTRRHVWSMEHGEKPIAHTTALAMRYLLIAEPQDSAATDQNSVK